MNGDEILLQPAYGDASAKTEQGVFKLYLRLQSF